MAMTRRFGESEVERRRWRDVGVVPSRAGRHEDGRKDVQAGTGCEITSN